jgi:peptidoglycan/LPS O-acetylase OafA/YrhL
VFRSLHAPTFDAYRQLKHFDALDGMRAVGVLLVIFEHFAGARYKWLSGWLGVHIFFVMSGFLITTLLLREQERNGRVSLVDFYIRRAFRIMPVYYLVFAIVLVQTRALGGEDWNQLKHAWPFYALFLNELDFVAPWKITWTMGIEWKFYLVWPVILFLVPLGPKLKAVATLSSFAVLAWLWDSPIKAPHYVVLLYGATIALLLHHRRAFEAMRWLMNPVAALLLLAAVIWMEVYGIRIERFAGGYGGGRGVVLYGAVVALLLPTLFNGGIVSRVLRSRAFVFVGRRSYALYLVQIMAAQALVGMNPYVQESARKAALVAITGLVFADVLYRWVEVPMIALGKRLIARRRERAAHEGAAMHRAT